MSCRRAYRSNEVRRCIHMRLGSRATPRASSVQARANVVDVRGATVTVRDGDRGLRKILNSVNFSLKAGELHMLVGPNGCGKSTLLRTIGGLTKSDSGTVQVNGPCAFVFQNPDNQIVMPTVASEVALGTGAQKLSNEEVAKRVFEVLGRVNMTEFAEGSTGTLSGGQKQRTAIAAALAQGPPAPQVLLLDELTTFLDAEDARSVLHAVRDVITAGGGMAGVWVTHRLEELKFADSVTCMDNGSVQMSGSPDRILNHLQMLGATM